MSRQDLAWAHRRGERAAAVPTPPLAWALALLLALSGAAGIVLPRVGVGLLALALLALVARAVIARPTSAFLVALCVFPLYPLFRGVVTLLGLPVPLSILGMWPELLLAASFAGILVRCIRRREALRLTWYDVPVVVLLAGGLFGVVTAASQRQIVPLVYGVHYSVSALLFYFAARWCRPDERDLRRVRALLLASYVLLALFSLADYALRTSVGVQLAMALRPMFSAHWDPQLFWRVYPRMQSLIFDENIWGSLSTLVALVSLARIASGTGGRPAWLLFCLATACVLLSMSRGSMACWLVGVVALLLLQGGGRQRARILWGCAGLAALLAAGLWTLRADPRFGALLERAASLTDTRSRVAYDRVDMWKQAWDNFERWPSGTGIGTAGHASLYHGGGGIITDGQYFKVAAEQGVPGLVAVAVGVVATLAVLARLRRGARGEERVFGPGRVRLPVRPVRPERRLERVRLLLHAPRVLDAGRLFVARRLGEGAAVPLFEEPPSEEESLVVSGC
jgi:hypothetical protein